MTARYIFVGISVSGVVLLPEPNCGCYCNFVVWHKKCHAKRGVQMTHEKAEMHFHDMQNVVLFIRLPVRTSWDVISVRVSVTSNRSQKWFWQKARQLNKLYMEFLTSL